MKQKGFTLIELLVVIAVFSIIIVVIMGIFISTIRIQRYSLVSQQLIDQTSYAMEYMSRLIRMAKKNTGSTGSICINMPDDSNFGGDGIRDNLRFVNYKDKCVKFYLSGDQIYQNLDGITLPLTSNKFRVTSFQFLVSGDIPGDRKQPKVTVILEIEGKNISPAPKLRIQTTLSQRTLDS